MYILISGATSPKLIKQGQQSNSQLDARVPCYRSSQSAAILEYQGTVRFTSQHWLLRHLNFFGVVHVIREESGDPESKREMVFTTVAPPHFSW
jgi:hypothetical protein